MRNPIKILIKKILSSRSAVLVYYSKGHRTEAIELGNNIKKEITMLLGDSEVCQLFMSVKATKDIKGDMAEVGVYMGGSSKIIREADNKRKLHLFDTFSGLPNPSKEDPFGKFTNGQYYCNLKSVKNYLDKYDNIKFYKGMFHENSNIIADRTFSFVHLDVDLYKSTLDALNFFYDRMNIGGIIISHDYNTCKGVKKAFDDFFSNKIEPIIEMSGSQCIVVKCDALVSGEEQ